MLSRLLAELPPPLRAAVDTAAFPALEPQAREELERLGEAVGAHLIVYDLRVEAEGLALCATVEEAELDADRLAALRGAERKLPPRTALVAYQRPVRLRVA